jgi:hypothetical protein
MGAAESRARRRIGITIAIFGIVVCSQIALVNNALATPACGDPHPHCYGEGTYDSQRYGVHSLVLIRNETVVSNFTAYFVETFVDSNNWMEAGYIDGNSIIGSTAVPKGFTDWNVGGTYGHSLFLCTPAQGTYQNTAIKRTSTTNVWTQIVCNTEMLRPKTLGPTAEGQVVTELTDENNTCHASFTDIRYQKAVGSSWSLWPSISTFLVPNGPPNPITIQQISTYEMHTCGG